MSHSEKKIGESSQNTPLPVLIFWRSIPCVFCLYVHYHKLLVVMFESSVHVSNGFPKEKFG